MKTFRLSRPGRSARSRTVSFTLPLPCVTNFTLSEDSRAKPSPSSTVYITSSACAPRGALNSSSSAVVPAFCRRPPDRARTSTGACILVAIVNGVYPLIHAINMATAFSFRFIERLISISLGSGNAEAFVLVIRFRPLILRHFGNVVSSLLDLDWQRSAQRRYPYSFYKGFALLICRKPGPHCIVCIICKREHIITGGRNSKTQMPAVG